MAERSTSQRPDSGRAGWLASVAAPGLMLLAVVCCAGPLLLAALIATGAGTWLAANGYLLGALAVFAVASGVAWRLLARIGHR